ncbi:NADPH-dependent FMN reductase [Rhodoligotrophos defluvii]|uniref:NADPH-dependent FMN reductase n=1 Tax=Rhodoligotrophos defluvii TaxID=2561934 RepID=UPI0010C9CD29|nr:NAD(P)H-dependent oxidoreductase [Rhodoligotrophos defluvii]
MSLILDVIIASTRPGRVGLPVGQWFYGFAKEQGSFDVKLLDLAEFDLPVFNEPKHPSLQEYRHEHTKRWSEAMAPADAYVFVMPEYNFGPTPALVNALNYLYREWNYKPAAIVSYGGVSGGLRSAQQTKLLITALKMMPIVEAVMIPNVQQHVKDGRFEPQEVHTKSASAMLKELHRWAEALKTMRG